MANRVKEVLAAGGSVVGVLDNTGSRAVGEMMALGGFDFVMFDMEHGATSEETLTDLVRRCEWAGAVPLARVWDKNPKLILRALDAGAKGVMVPQVESGEEAAHLARAFKYHPDGFRSLAKGVPAGLWGKVPNAEHLRAQNEDALVILQIETARGLEATDAIVATPGVDVIFIGPSDLSQALGHPGDAGHPEVRAAFERIARAAVAAGKAVGTITNSAADARWQAPLGVRFFVAGAAGIVLGGARRVADDVRSAL